MKKEEYNTSERELSMTRIVNAPIKLVWEVFTKPEHIKHWWGPDGFTNTMDKMDVKVGGVWEFVMHSPNGMDYKIKNTFKEIIKEERIVFENAEKIFLTTISFTAEGKKTVIKWQMLFASKEQLNEVVKMHKADIGLKQNIDKLEEYLKKQEMKNNLLFDFTVDKASKTVFVNREFAANLSLVWDAFTKQEMLDKWWAPKPWLSKTKSMNFKVGGQRFYAMVSPEGQEHWAIEKYTSISPKTNFKMHNAFADKDENPQLPGSDWDLNFSEQNGITKVSIRIKNESLERMEKMIEMGFQGGFTMGLQQLDELLSKK